MTKKLLATVAFVSFALLSGCANNAIFEIKMQIPATMQPIPTSPPITHVKIQIQPGPTSWSDDWAVAATETVGPIALTDSPREITIDVVGDSDHLDSPVVVRILYCSSDSCGTSVTERWFEFEHPFYKGKVTYYQISPELTTMGLEVDDSDGSEPPEDQIIGKCQVGGCVETNGEFLLNYCPSPNVHWCERQE